MILLLFGHCNRPAGSDRLRVPSWLHGPRVPELPFLWNIDLSLERLKGEVPPNKTRRTSRQINCILILHKPPFSVDSGTGFDGLRRDVPTRKTIFQYVARGMPP